MKLICFHHYFGSNLVVEGLLPNELGYGEDEEIFDDMDM